MLFAGLFIRLSSVQRGGRSSLLVVHPGSPRLKRVRKYLIGLVLLLAAAAVLLWFLPARWVLPWVEPRLHGLHLQQVSGSIWDGRAGAVISADAQSLGQLQWQLSRRAVLGQSRLHLEFSGARLRFAVEAARLRGGETELRDVSIRTTSAMLDHPLDTPWGQPRGELQVSIPHALLRGGWPMQMDAEATWHDAIMHTAKGDVALGTLHGTAQARGGVVQAQWRDAGQGPLQVAGTLQLAPFGWRLDATLRPRQTAPALRRWLATLATPAADGSVHIQRHGGLATSPPPTH